MQEVKRALRTVIEQSGNQMAIAYARIGLSQPERDLAVQCLYVLSNLGSWRGEVARATKDVLRKYAKENGR